jgi:hypothetical protein
VRQAQLYSARALGTAVTATTTAASRYMNASLVPLPEPLPGLNGESRVLRQARQMWNQRRTQ